MNSIIDNQTGNSLKERIELLDDGGRELAIATAFFSIDALCLLAEHLEHFDHVRLIFGDDASETERRKLLHDMVKLSEKELLIRREENPLLTPLMKVKQLIEDGKFEARCYTTRKFHAKAYVVHRPGKHPEDMGIIGSGNFTRYGLTKNLELNVELSSEQTANLKEWYDERWEEAVRDDVSEKLLEEISRHLELYHPFVIFLKALFLWGTTIEVQGKEYEHSILDQLDIHQKKGYAQALRLIQKHHGAMICDGVGLGKSFIALAIMEHFCLQGKKVLLVAPKNILESGWYDYLNTYLEDFQGENFGTLKAQPMTDFGFEPDKDKIIKPSDRKRWQDNKALRKWADVVIVDESHNFRTSSASRYVNLKRALQPFGDNRKEVVLFSATPVNTKYMDMANQISLIVPDSEVLAGYKPEMIRKDADEQDKKATTNAAPAAQLQMIFDDGPLHEAKKEIVIQRSRATCRAWALAERKTLSFPVREAPRGLEWQIQQTDTAWRELLSTADRIFTSGVAFLKKLDDDLKKARAKDTEPESALLVPRPPATGLLFGAFLLEQYRKTENKDKKIKSDELHLAKLIYTNTIKQLESSLPAFKGIIQSLGAGLLARLRVVLKEKAHPVLSEHAGWAGTPQQPTAIPQTTESGDEDESGDTDAEAESGDALDYNGAETDQWLVKIGKSRGLEQKLIKFISADYDIDRWAEDVVSDLGFLKQIYELTVKAEVANDPKLEFILAELNQQLKENKKVLIFTQSVRTSRYIEREFAKRLTGINVARIDSSVTETRPAILHAFSPNYNKAATAPSVPKVVNVLISTDVLSEGVNLQEAQAIINYDLPWNPTRLMQRIGRIDRRLKLKEGESPHSFAILNVIPPRPLEVILKLVGRVEGRTIIIHKTLGLDQSFFKASDPEGTLKEFNKDYEGEIPAIAHLQTEMVRTAANLTEEERGMLERLPPGGFGVWEGAPVDGYFGLFQWKPTDNCPDADKKRYAGLVGEPVFVLEGPDKKTCKTDAEEILALLSKTKRGELSGDPSGPDELSQALKRLKTAARDTQAMNGLPRTILPELVCWMELRRPN